MNVKAQKEKIKVFVEEHKKEVKIAAVITGGAIAGMIGASLGYKNAWKKVLELVPDGVFVTEPIIVKCLESADKFNHMARGVSVFYTDDISSACPIKNLGSFGETAIKMTPPFNDKTKIISAILVGVNPEEN